jgi:hypothetical protein
MPWKYNPFTDALDQTGSGGGSYIDGEVEYHSNLPVTVGSPAVNSAFLVRKGEGLYFVSRKPAGIWVRELNNGNLDDWKYAGTFSDLYRDANFRILNNADVSKELAFDVSGVTTGTTRTLTVPDASGTIALTTTAPASHSHGNLTNDGKIGTTANLPLKTGSGGVVEAGSFGTAAGTFCEGNDARLSANRDPNAHAASHAAGTAASYTGIGDNETFSEEVTITANTAGTAGNSITLTFDGVDDVDTVLAAWNAANPSNQATLDSGDGGQVPDDGDLLQLSGGVTGGSDPFANINQDLGTTDTPTFAGINSTDQIGVEAAGSDGEAGILLDNTQYGKWLLYTGVGSQDSLGVYSFGNGTNTAAADVFVFVNNNGEGRMGVATPAPEYALDVDGQIRFSESVGFTATDTTDETKKVSLDVSGVTTETTVSLEIPNASGKIALQGAITSSGLTQATARILGRTTASTGAVEEIQIGSGLSLSAGELSATGGSGSSIMQSIAVGFVLN